MAAQIEDSAAFVREFCQGYVEHVAERLPLNYEFLNRKWRNVCNCAQARVKLAAPQDGISVTTR